MVTHFTHRTMVYNTVKGLGHPQMKMKSTHQAFVHVWNTN